MPDFRHLQPLLAFVIKGMVNKVLRMSPKLVVHFVAMMRVLMLSVVFAAFSVVFLVERAESEAVQAEIHRSLQSVEIDWRARLAAGEVHGAVPLSDGQIVVAVRKPWNHKLVVDKVGPQGRLWRFRGMSRTSDFFEFLPNKNGGGFLFVEEDSGSEPGWSFDRLHNFPLIKGLRIKQIRIIELADDGMITSTRALPQKVRSCEPTVGIDETSFVFVCASHNPSRKHMAAPWITTVTTLDAETWLDSAPKTARVYDSGSSIEVAFKNKRGNIAVVATKYGHSDKCWGANCHNPETVIFDPSLRLLSKTETGVSDTGSFLEGSRANNMQGFRVQFAPSGFRTQGEENFFALMWKTSDKSQDLSASNRWVSFQGDGTPEYVFEFPLLFQIPGSTIPVRCRGHADVVRNVYVVMFCARKQESLLAAFDPRRGKAFVFPIDIGSDVKIGDAHQIWLTIDSNNSAYLLFSKKGKRGRVMKTKPIPLPH